MNSLIRKLLLFTFPLIISGCFFSITTAQLFLGTDDTPIPEHRSRIATGTFMAPFAVVFDLISFPVQFVILVIAGDDLFENIFLYVSNDEGQVIKVPMDDDSRRLLAKAVEEEKDSLFAPDFEGPQYIQLDKESNYMASGPLKTDRFDETGIRVALLSNDITEITGDTQSEQSGAQ